MNSRKKNKNISIIKMISIGMFMQGILFLIAFGSVIANDAANAQRFWIVSKYFLMLGVICYVCMLCFGVFFRRALSIHLIFSFSIFLWIAPVLLAGFELSLKNKTLLLIVLILSFINVVMSYRSTLKKLISKDMPSVKSGRLNIEQGLWDLDKHLIHDESRRSSESLVKILIPFGVVFGTFLFRNFPSQDMLIAVLFNFVLVASISSGIGVHIAASKHIMLIEKKYKKYIQV